MKKLLRYYLILMIVPLFILGSCASAPEPVEEPLPPPPVEEPVEEPLPPPPVEEPVPDVSALRNKASAQRDITLTAKAGADEALASRAVPELYNEAMKTLETADKENEAENFESAIALYEQSGAAFIKAGEEAVIKRQAAEAAFQRASRAIDDSEARIRAEEAELSEELEAEEEAE